MREKLGKQVKIVMVVAEGTILFRSLAEATPLGIPQPLQTDRPLKGSPGSFRDDFSNAAKSPVRDKKKKNKCEQAGE